MYQISQLARLSGLARSTLLYYEKLGILSGLRGSNGYRYYSDDDLQRLELTKLLHAGGLTLKECLSCVEAGVERSMLEQHMAALDEDIANKQIVSLACEYVSYPQISR